MSGSLSEGPDFGHSRPQGSQGEQSVAPIPARDCGRLSGKDVAAAESGCVLILGIFGENSPERCSCIRMRLHSEVEVVGRLKNWGAHIKWSEVDQVTSFDTVRNFLFCAIRRSGTGTTFPRGPLHTAISPSPRTTPASARSPCRAARARPARCVHRHLAQAVTLRSRCDQLHACSSNSGDRPHGMPSFRLFTSPA